MNNRKNQKKYEFLSKQHDAPGGFWFLAWNHEIRPFFGGFDPFSSLLDPSKVVKTFLLWYWDLRNTKKPWKKSEFPRKSQIFGYFCDRKKLSKKIKKNLRFSRRQTIFWFFSSFEIFFKNVLTKDWSIWATLWMKNNYFRLFFLKKNIFFHKIISFSGSDRPKC